MRALTKRNVRIRLLSRSFHMLSGQHSVGTIRSLILETALFFVALRQIRLPTTENAIAFLKMLQTAAFYEI